MVQVQESQGASRLARIARVSHCRRQRHAGRLGRPAALGRGAGRGQAAHRSTLIPESSRSCSSSPGRARDSSYLAWSEAKAPNRRSAAAGLAIRGVDDGSRRRRRLEPGTAARLPQDRASRERHGRGAVDDEGRLELKTRWFSGQIGQVAIVMLVVAGLEFCLGFLALLTLQSIDTVLSLVGVICFTGLAAGLAFCKWPQLVRPTAFCFLAKVVQMVLGIFGNAVGSAVAGFATWPVLCRRPASSARTPEAFGVGFGAAALFVFGTFVSVSLLVFFLYLGRRAWRIDQEYRSMAGGAARAQQYAGFTLVDRPAGLGGRAFLRIGSHRQFDIQSLRQRSRTR